ncbi:UDP-N-acetylglucosamine 2-epimerase [Methanoregula formicica]|uniref:UDP-N-acetyl-D-glucosamine 2-epimerase, UDP-hydrolysing n=1 Tax=Methanoregula formicica (strain DSM 22288 / NBRC 105244 / SMSP) TaxID=593750 RepID=L0HGA3_METFS|nr:UDP-N-acetylglucosamine 2-epimerase [Methanoregula formicica]AGB02348.1 UDP-N-acetyl-D-glucosamine 2-epimerase, UDP-hydrolysing [Methanoregula formicica SMSP]
MKQKILYISGTRADYGLMRSVLFQIKHHPEMELHIIVTGMHLMPEFGSTITEIKQDGFRYHIVDTIQEEDSKGSMAEFIGHFIQNLVTRVREIQPDKILILGDRGEMLGGAIVGAYMGIPVFHVHGGEVTSTVDEFARHAITKLSHIHLAATAESAERIRKMGENPEHIFVVGAPGLDQIYPVITEPDMDVITRYGIDPQIPLILVIQHPVPLEPGDPAAQMEKTLQAVSKIRGQVFVIYPNADAGGRAMIETIKQYESLPNIRTFQNVNHADYLHLLKISSVIVGNSSSGIIEAPTFGVPAINIGSRQNGRQKGENVVDTGYDSDQIAQAIEYGLHDVVFRQKVKAAKNPYGDGRSSGKIVKILESVVNTPDLVQKRMMY